MSYLEAVNASSILKILKGHRKSLFSKVTWIFTKHTCMKFCKEFCDAFKIGNFLKHLLMAASVTCFFNFHFVNLSTLFRKFYQYTQKAFIKNWSACRLDQACDEKQQLQLTWWVHLQKARRMRIHIYLLYECKKLLVKFIGQFWDCWYHNTPYYTTNNSVIRTCLLITGAHKNWLLLYWGQRWILFWYRRKKVHQKP